MARFFSSPARLPGGKLLLRHPSRAAGRPRPVSPWARAPPSTPSVRDSSHADASSSIFQPALRDSCSFPLAPRRISPHPEKIFFVYRSSKPPELPGVASRVLCEKEMKNIRIACCGELLGAKAGGAPAYRETVLPLVFQER